MKPPFLLALVVSSVSQHKFEDGVKEKLVKWLATSHDLRSKICAFL